MILKEIITFLEQIAPSALQESYDNSQLLCGNVFQVIDQALICLDVTEAIVDEAISRKANLIIAHHPIVFSGLKSLTGKNYVERVIIKAIKNDIAIYAIHTNLDNVIEGVNAKIAEKIGLKNTRILAPKNHLLRKLVYFCPSESYEKVRQAIFDTGAGNIGNYSNASFNSSGIGTFEGNEKSQPQKGEKLHFEQVEEMRTEIIFPFFLQDKVIQTLKKTHPYEEVAYDVYALENEWKEVGSGLLGELVDEMEVTLFLKKIKEAFKCDVIRHTALVHQNIKTVALCGGSGSFLLNAAKAQNADIYISADFKYHEFFDAENKIIIADIGHYESEQFTIEFLFEKLSKKIPTFAFLLTGENTNPVQYYI
jgi:dinuclear metal center YbgI/SA1388 family protein